MVNEKEILEVFDRLALTSEEERRRILSQGVILNQEEKKTVFWIEADNITNVDERGKSDAGLE